MKLLRQIPSIDPIRAALLVALLQTPHRFRTKRRLRAYTGNGGRSPSTCCTASLLLATTGDRLFISTSLSIPPAVGSSNN